MKYLFTVAYDGRAYHGYQVQKGHVTVQEKLQDAIEKLYGKRYPIVGCSRTDSGVHARDFKAAIFVDDDAPAIPVDRLPLALNIFLPEDISVKKADIVSDTFHPRYDVRLKEYEYLILNSKVRDPFLFGRAYLYPLPLDEKMMNRAAEHLKGTHDFSAFMTSGSDVSDCVRTIYDCTVTRNGSLVSIRISGSGFLYNMVRIITGTLIEVSAGRFSPEDIDSILASRDRSRAGFTAPACGLYLNRVVY